MTVTVLRRFAFLLGMLVISFAIFKCGSSSRYARERAEVFCKTGNGSPNRPMICVDERTLIANPREARVFEVDAKNNKPTNRAVEIHWFTQRAADLRVDFNKDNSSCTEPVMCDGTGHCWTKARRLNAGEKERRCTYGMRLGENVLDPESDIVITPCCW